MNKAPGSLPGVDHAMLELPLCSSPTKAHLGVVEGVRVAQALVDGQLQGEGEGRSVKRMRAAAGAQQQAAAMASMAACARSTVMPAAPAR